MSALTAWPLATAAAPATHHASWGLPALAAIIFTAILLWALLLTMPMRRDNRTPQLADRIGRYGPGQAEGARGGTAASAALGWVGGLLGANGEQKLATRLEHAGISRKPAEWVVLGAVSCIVATALLTLATGNLFIALLLAVLGSWLGMRFLLNIKISRRRAAFADQLPNVLQLVAGSLRTGFSLAQALNAVVREDSQPAAGEFARALAETRLGLDLAAALDGVADRMDSRDLKWTVMAIRIQREVGGNLAEVLRNTVGTMRERAYLRRHVRALSAEGRLSAYILVALPVLIGTWLMLTNNSYMRPLYTTPYGLIMFTGAVVLLVVGALWMRKLIRVVV